MPLKHISKLATVHFCTEIVSAVKPISELSTSCLGSLKQNNPNGIMEKCSSKKLSPLKTDIQRISSHKHIIFSIKDDKAIIVCSSKHRLPTTKSIDIQMTLRCSPFLFLPRITLISD